MRLDLSKQTPSGGPVDVVICGVAVVIDLAIEEPPIQSPRDIVYC
jgi:hypothetical protein